MIASAVGRHEHSEARYQTATAKTGALKVIIEA
jgi:hypothetical protein